MYLKISIYSITHKKKKKKGLEISVNNSQNGPQVNSLHIFLF